MPHLFQSFSKLSANFWQRTVLPNLCRTFVVKPLPTLCQALDKPLQKLCLTFAKTEPRLSHDFAKPLSNLCKLFLNFFLTFAKSLKNFVNPLPKRCSLSAKLLETVTNSCSYFLWHGPSNTPQFCDTVPLDSHLSHTVGWSDFWRKNGLSASWARLL